MNRLKALLIVLSAACIGIFAYIAMLPGLYGQPHSQNPEDGASKSSAFSSSLSSVPQPAEPAEQENASSPAGSFSAGKPASPSEQPDVLHFKEARAAPEAAASSSVSLPPSSMEASPLDKEQNASSAAEEAASPDEGAEAVAALSARQLDPGETLVVTVTGARSPQSLSIRNDFGFVPRFSPLDDNTFVSFLPLSYFTQPGQYVISVAGDDFSEPVSFDIEVTDKQFEVQQLTVKEETAEDTIFSDEASKEYRAKIWPLKELYDDNRYFDGRFLLPVEGPITTQFGMIRYVNGQPNPRHDGVDLSAAAGTPVLCAQNGKVLFADFVKLTGNTVVVEHGYGLKSWYFHMQSLDVKEGDAVKTGDVLGRVGSTGFSTGPHLHFSASVNGVYINPFTLIETDLLDTITETLS